MLIRHATRVDAPALASLINAIIEKGGTTAHEDPFSEEGFAAHYLEGPDFISCAVAEDDDGRLIGYQSLGLNAELPEGWGDIGTFVALGTQARGIGQALFALTREEALRAGVKSIYAQIRADNTGGLAYYAKMGFVDYDVMRAVPLRDGTLVDRVCKKYEIA